MNVHEAFVLVDIVEIEELESKSLKVEEINSDSYRDDKK